MTLSGKYIDPFTDFGFKKLFGSETNKDLLIDLLNTFLKGKKQIVSLSYFNNEKLGRNAAARKAVLDLYCGSSNGEKFIVEMQKAKQDFFKDRSLYYSTYPIQEAALPGDQWDYRLPEIYTIGIMDFVFDNNHPQKFIHEVKLTELHTREIFYDKLTFLFLEMPKFNKRESELENTFDKWLYLLKNLNRLSGVPVKLREPLFQKAFSVAEVVNLNNEEMTAYEQSLKEKRDWNNAWNTAMRESREKGFEQGRAEGREEGKMEGREAEAKKNALEMKKRGFPIETIIEITGLPKTVIEKLS